ncbi:GNAT family N-acetyltransferase [Vibrio coralliilyticus]|uniref:GNAT family N-acetyltransferase n=1 Tax=Vibrio coralliilyticus TaxID=190893 RepID=UPI001E3C0BCE|nr:GNAT family N-acetyltransferase [Vibrio coralliilyticus]MCC2525774.1 GNAT family N-acetyltransferase [Vibrio coralliilyticus]
MKLKNDIRLEIRKPTVNQYNSLRKAVGRKEVDKYRANLALNNSIFTVCASSGDKVVGIGRIVGDGAIYFYIEDIMVCPKYQRLGIGSSIMEKMMSNVKTLTRKESGAFVRLMAGKDLVGFYSKYGFSYQGGDISFFEYNGLNS